MPHLVKNSVKKALYACMHNACEAFRSAQGKGGKTFAAAVDPIERKVRENLKKTLDKQKESVYYNQG